MVACQMLPLNLISWPQKEEKTILRPAVVWKLPSIALRGDPQMKADLSDVL